MLELIAALRALQETGTTGRAATRLRISQSAVSKRIAALEVRVGAPLLVRDGRNVRLTPAALRLLEGALPLLRSLEEQLERLGEGADPPVRLAATESLVASWLPERLRAAVDRAGVELEIHAHRGPLSLDRLRAGEVDVAVVVAAEAEGLKELPLAREPMGIVPSRERPLAPQEGEVIPVLTIEPGSLTGAWLARRLRRWRGPWRVEPAARIESFISAVQLARAGFGHALVPVGLARCLGVPEAAILPLAGLARPVVACARPSSWERPAVQRFLSALKAEIQRSPPC